MPRGHKYQRSSSGALSHNTNKKKNYTPRNHSDCANVQQDMGSFERCASYQPPAEVWYRRPGRYYAKYNGPSLRPFYTPAPYIPQEFACLEPYYPVVPFAVDRGFSGPVRHGYPDYHNRLFSDEYRFPSPHQVYQPPHVAGDSQGAPAERAWGAENVAELEDKPLGQKNKLRGDAPEFVPRSKFADKDESREKKDKEPCWLVVSSQ
ncbi:hypothetical protein BJY01DRAFT_253334 [Aspergillus pseudoustus]|uniref:Uncharacterized protein n=1 Tax=Aspergillus pseudoustus TaxID=1810923 RepID=A0ABR4J1M1_9EURO